MVLLPNMPRAPGDRILNSLTPHITLDIFPKFEGVAYVRGVDTKSVGMGHKHSAGSPRREMSPHIAGLARRINLAGRNRSFHPLTRRRSLASVVRAC